MFIYCIRNVVNGKMIIGQTVQSAPRRWADYKCALKRGNYANSYLQRSWNKYGENVWEFEMIEECDTIEKLNQQEIYYINELNTMAPHGYNLKPGGRNPGHLTEEHKEKIRQANLGKRLSPDHKRKISQSLMGHVVSHESRMKISQSSKGYSRNKGKTLSESTKRKISKSLRGNIPWNKGKCRPEMAGNNNPAKRPEVRKKISRALRGNTNRVKK